MAFVQRQAVEEALADFGLLNVKKIDPGKVISKFLKGDITDPDRIESKNKILIHLIETQNLGFGLSVPIRNQCTHCGGRGFDVILFSAELVKCELHIIIDEKTGKRIYEGCNGTGWKLGECTRCGGSGKLEQSESDPSEKGFTELYVDGHNDSICYTCKGRGTYLYKKTDKYPGKKCLKCHGTGKVKKLIQRESEIASVNLCKKCGGSGISTNIGTAVINPELANKLKALIPESHFAHVSSIMSV